MKERSERSKGIRADGDCLMLLDQAFAMMQAEYPGEIKKYKAQLMRSKSWKPIWIDLNVGQATLQKPSKNTFASDDFGRTQLSLRYALGNFVLVGLIQVTTMTRRF